MLEKIRIEQLEIGMHVDSICGRWFEHPFWRTRFVVRNESELVRLRASSITECWIDTSKGPRPGARPAADGVAQGIRDAPAVATNRIDAAADGAPALGTPAGGTPAGGTPVGGMPVGGMPVGGMPVGGTPAAEGQRDSATRRPPVAARGSCLEDELDRATTFCRQAGKAMEDLFHEARFGGCLQPERVLPLLEGIAESVSRHPSALIALARVRTHHGYTFLHSIGVAALMYSLARRLGFAEAGARETALAGLLHDVGKSSIPGELLNKPARLSGAEFERMKEHPRVGHDLLQATGASESVLLVCLQHHERYDGGGYPAGLSGSQIALVARMNAVCDVYDAITSSRPYKRAWDPGASLVRMNAWTKSGQFDPTVFSAFVETVGAHPIGSLVRMRSGRLAVVVDQNEGKPWQPTVKVFYSTRSGMPVPVKRIDLSRPGADDAIVARESNTDWGFPHLDSMLIGDGALRRAALA